MSEYIDKAAVLNSLNDWYFGEMPYAKDDGRASAQARTVCATIKMCIKGIEETPVADVAPVRHSRFDHSKKVDMTAVCEKCRDDKFWFHRSLRGDEHYCPNCGAKMEMEAEK